MIRKYWTNEDIEKLELNYLKLSNKKLAILLNRTEGSISSQMKILGLNRMWTKEEDDILIKNYGINNYYDYKNLLPNRTLSSIFNRAFSLKLKSKEKIKNIYKYNVDHHFFNEINNLSCYWAGFIAADGYLKNDCNCLGIKLAEKDLQHLEKFKIDIKSNSPIRKKITKLNDKLFLSSELTIYSRYIVKDLYNNFNITPNKTFTLVPPNIKNFDHKISYIVGLIDGDGSIGKKINTDQIHIQLIGSKEIILWYKNILNEWLKLKKTKKISCRNNIYSKTIGDKNSKKFIKYIKKLNIPYMKRKWNKYEFK